MIESYREAVARARKEYLERVMREAGYQIIVAAKLAERNRTDFYKLLEKYAPHIKTIPIPRNQRRKKRRLDIATSGNAAWRALDERL